MTRVDAKPHDAADANDRDAITAALATGADINALSGGKTPLMRAVLSGNGKAAKALIKAGADATIGDTATGYTPMHGAALEGRVGIVKGMLKMGMDPNLM